MSNRNGIYMPNRDYVPGNAQVRYDTAHFAWAVVRTDSGPLIGRWCKDRNADIIIQCPDHFNRYPPRDPYAYANTCLAAADPFRPFAHKICLDNQPNLVAIHGGRWFAEEWARWYRALAASFRWLDKRCHWQLVYPAICQPYTNLGRYWLQVGIENLRESEFLGVHVYWAGHEDYSLGRAEITLQPYEDLQLDKPILVLEYGDGDFSTPDETEAKDYLDFVTNAPDQVKACCKFILEGTQEWSDFYLTDRQAARLGQYRPPGH